jgi:NAD(P)-dependent dehydrogenase (short-subunit alcohol dehydrogenase family)
MAEIMASEGATVVAVDNHQGRLDEAMSALGTSDGKVEGKLVDALDAAQVDGLVAEVERSHGRIDILVNAVGGGKVIDKPAAMTEQLSLADGQKLIAFNLDGTFRGTHAVIPVMRRHRSGEIVNLASIAGRGLSANSTSAYAAVKGGIIAFTRKLGHERAPDGINVNAIAPSVTLTERIRTGLGEAVPGSPGRGDRTDSLAPHCRGRRSGAGNLLPGRIGRRLCHRHHDRCDRRRLGPEGKGLCLARLGSSG